MRKNREIKFAAMADIHLDIMHDGEERLNAFLKAADNADVDFVIHLGDFAYPNDTSDCNCPYDEMPENLKYAYTQPSTVDKEAILKKYNRFHRPTYHTMGNHDFDFLSHEDTCKMYEIENGYYSFHMGGWHFIVVDGNYYRDEEGNYHHYCKADYFYRDIPYVDPMQLKWIENELMDGDEPVVMFSHQPLFDYNGGIKNYKEFGEVIAKARARGKIVRLCINGHLHVDDLDEVDGTLYYNLNSTSCMWVGEGEMERARYSPEIEKEFPNLKYVIPYEKPVYSIITINDEGISVEGVDGRYVQPGPKSIGYKDLISPSSETFARKWPE